MPTPTATSPNIVNPTFPQTPISIATVRWLSLAQCVHAPYPVVTWWKIVARIASRASGLRAAEAWAAEAEDQGSGTASAKTSSSRASVRSWKPSVQIV